jgi:hypothetical protein
MKSILLAGLVTLAFGGAASSASASSHNYCDWTTGYTLLTAYALCPEPYTHYITRNDAWLPWEEDTFIYCGAALDGTQYGSNNVGSPSCFHTYAGANDLKAYTYVGPNGRRVYGLITW